MSRSITNDEVFFVPGAIALAACIILAGTILIILRDQNIQQDYRQWKEILFSVAAKPDADEKTFSKLMNTTTTHAAETALFLKKNMVKNKLSFGEIVARQNEFVALSPHERALRFIQDPERWPEMFLQLAYNAHWKRFLKESNALAALQRIFETPEAAVPEFATNPPDSLTPLLWIFLAWLLIVQCLSCAAYFVEWFFMIRKPSGLRWYQPLLMKKSWIATGFCMFIPGGIPILVLAGIGSCIYHGGVSMATAIAMRRDRHTPYAQNDFADQNQREHNLTWLQKRLSRGGS